MNNATNIRHFALTVYVQHKNFLLKGRALQGHRQGATYAGRLLCGSPQKGRRITRSGDAQEGTAVLPLWRHLKGNLAFFQVSFLYHL